MSNYFDQVSQRLGTIDGETGKPFKFTKVFKCSADLRLYVDNLWLKEALMIRWAEHVQRTPVYGYDSIMFDTVLEGHKIILGDVVLNMVKPGQLYSVLEHIGYSPRPNSQKHVSATSSNRVNTDQAYYDLINRYAREGSAGVQSDPASPVPPKHFTLQIVAGDLNDDETLPSLTILRDVYLTGNEFIQGENAQPIAEKYSFLAKTIDNPNLPQS